MWKGSPCKTELDICDVMQPRNNFTKKLFATCCVTDKFGCQTGRNASCSPVVGFISDEALRLTNKFRCTILKKKT